MLKIVGICILLFAIFCISRTMCEKERARVALLSEISRFMHEIRHSLALSMKPLSEICHSFRADEPYLELLLKDELKPLSDPSSVGELEERVGRDATEVFVNFVLGFGRGYLNEEIARTDIATKAFDDILSGEKDIASRRLRVCKTLGVASSFALVIFVI